MLGTNRRGSDAQTLAGRSGSASCVLHQVVHQHDEKRVHLRPSHSDLHVVLRHLHGGVQFLQVRSRALLKGIRMVHIYPVAEVLDPSIFAELPEAHRPAGLAISEVLSRADGDDMVEIPVPISMRDELRLLAEVLGAADAAAEAEVTVRRVPVGHLRGLEPHTRVLLSIRMQYSADEGKVLRDR